MAMVKTNLANAYVILRFQSAVAGSQQNKTLLLPEAERAYNHPQLACSVDHVETYYYVSTRLGGGFRSLSSC
jgi:hypothetical protein